MKRRNILLAMALMLTGTVVAQETQTTREKCNHCKNAEQVVLNNILTRTSVRQYQEKTVEQEKVEAMLRAAMAAPTAVNRQPWHFVVINERAVFDKLAEANPRNRMLKTAPLAIVVCGDMEKALQGEAQQFWIQDTSAAAENILLAAHGLGLGAVWTALFPDKKCYEPVKDILGMPENVVPLNIILIGYPAESPTPKDKWKPENVSYNKY